MRQPIAAMRMKLLIYLYSHSCKAASLCFAGFHTTCSSPVLGSGSYCVLQPASFISSSFASFLFAHYLIHSFQQASVHPLPMLVLAAHYALGFGCLASVRLGSYLACAFRMLSHPCIVRHAPYGLKLLRMPPIGLSSRTPSSYYCCSALGRAREMLADKVCLEIIKYNYIYIKIYQKQAYEKYTYR